jgi:quinol-cytochrome oxidoreductase complex cytochrome b subunit
MKGLIIFIASIIAFISLSFWAFSNMETDLEISGMLFTIMFTIGFSFILFRFFFSFKPKQKNKPTKF